MCEEGKTAGGFGWDAGNSSDRRWHGLARLPIEIRMYRRLDAPGGRPLGFERFHSVRAVADAE